MLTLLADPFDAAITYNPIFDAFRIAVLALGLAILGRVAVVLFSGEHKTWIASQRAAVALFSAMALHMIIQQIQTLGEDLIWWRLPLMAFIGINACIVLWAPQAVRGKDVNRSTVLYLVTRAAVEDALCDRDRLSGRPCTNGAHQHEEQP